MALSTLLALDDAGTLFTGSSFLMADPMVPFLDQDDEEALSPSSALEALSPSSPASFYPSPYQSLCASPPSTASVLSPAASPVSTFLEADELSFWLDGPEMMDTGKSESFSNLDLCDFDLESLIDSCGDDKAPSSPQDLIGWTPDMGLDFDTLALPAPQSATGDMQVKVEPVSPPPSTEHLELGSEVDVLSVADKLVPAAAVDLPSTQSFLLLPTGLSMVVLTAKAESVLALPATQILLSSVSPGTDSGIDSPSSTPTHVCSPAHSTPPASPPSPPPPSSPSACSSRTKPYSRPETTSSPVSSKCDEAGKVKCTSSAVSSLPARTVEKKLKKMEQNKTAATRYRQKKRVEQEELSVECRQLEERNRVLSERADALAREIKYLTDLMEEVRNAKNRRRVRPATAST